jgi:hypothetical protein
LLGCQKKGSEASICGRDKKAKANKMEMQSESLHLRENWYEQQEIFQVTKPEFVWWLLTSECFGKGNKQRQRISQQFICPSAHRHEDGNRDGKMSA